MSLERDFDQLDRQIDRLLRGTERNLGREYNSMLRQLRNKIGDFFAQYADSEDRLTLQEMMKYERLDKLNREVAKLTRESYTPIAREIRKGLRSSLTTSFDSTKEAVGEAAGRTIRGVLKDETINEILQTPHSGLKLNRRLQRRRADVIDRIQETLTQGMRDGERYRSMATRLKTELEDDMVKASRIVRTEGKRVQTLGSKQALDHASSQGVVMKKKWVSSKDERVRDKHAEMDGQVVEYDDDFVAPDGDRGWGPGLFSEPHNSINCRCIYVVEVVAVE